MCGISGIHHHTFEQITNMNIAQKHRGPDASGTYIDAEQQLSLGHTRLSIIDIHDGAQPMTDSTENYTIIFNGEIFNAPQLRTELEKEGITFRTNHSDTEVLLQLYIHSGEKMLDKLNGMFSFVIYNKEKTSLFGARDQFGIKPLYYVHEPDQFAFASEIKAITKVFPDLKQLNEQAVYHYLTFQVTPAPHTIFKHIKKIPAAHQFTYSLRNKELKIKKYWSPEFNNSCSFSGDDLYHYVFEEVKSAIQRWSLSDVEIACSLSGGLDSSIVTGVLAESNKNIRTYSLGFDDAPEIDERPLAKLVAEKWSTNHSEIVISPDDLLNYLGDMFSALDEPYAGGLPSWFVFKEMSKSVKVGMTGSGGDELFGNYRKWDRYNSFRDKLYHYRSFLKRGAITDLLKSPNGSLHYPYFTDKEKNKILLNTKHKHSAQLVQDLWQTCTSSNPKDKVAHVDLQLQLPEEFLFMTDRFSMNYSLEARTPFLDKQLVESIYNIPSHQRSSLTEPKGLLKNAAKGFLPDELINAKKMGFVLPVKKWMATSLQSNLNDLFSESYLRKQNLFRSDLLENIIQPSIRQEDYPWQAWTLYCFQYWYDINFA